MQLPWEAIVALGIYILGSTVGFIWWMATITAQLNFLIGDLKSLKEAGLAKQSDVDKEFGRVQKDIDAAHRRIDEMQLSGHTK